MTRMMDAAINPPDIRLVHLDKIADREDYLVRVAHEQNQYEFRLSITGTTIAIWQIDNVDDAAALLADRVIYSHGTASAFPAEGYWFDSNISASTLDETLQDILNRGAREYLHPSIRTGLAKDLFSTIDDLDKICVKRFGHPFVRSLDVLSERSQASDDFERAADDHAHLIYGVSLISAIIDRFDFDTGNGSANGLKAAMTSSVDATAVETLTEPLFMIKKLRRQYPIHEEYEVDGAGIRSRRRDLKLAETYFGFKNDAAADWSSVRASFLDALKSILDALSSEDDGN